MNGDKESIDRIVNHDLRLVVYLAKLYNLTKEGVRYIENKCLNIFSKDLEALKLYVLAENREENIGIILKYGVSNKK